MRWPLRGSAAILALAGATLAPSAAIASGPSALGHIHHVFVIVLENESYATTFGPNSPAPYLSQTLPSQGALLTQYFGIGHVSNDNYVAMISGQAPNPQTQSDCQVYSDFVGPGVVVTPGQAVGTGCVFPASVPTVANQLTAAGLSWKGYMEDMGNIPSRDGGSACGHPALNSVDGTQSAVAGDGYATRHNPFVYFHSIIDDQAYCAAHVVPLGTTTSATGLAVDLAQKATTPNLAFITPDLCDDGHDPSTPGQTGCANEAGPGGLAQADQFLRTWVPTILASPAYNDGGLLVIAFDESSPVQDTSACCGEQAGPNSPLPGINGPGGGRTGAVMLSPYIAPGTVSSVGYNHYSLLLSIETAFGLTPLGEAAQPGLQPLGPDVFTTPPT